MGVGRAVSELRGSCLGRWVRIQDREEHVRVSGQRSRSYMAELPWFEEQDVPAGNKNSLEPEVGKEMRSNLKPRVATRPPMPSDHESVQKFLGDHRLPSYQIVA